MINKRAFVANTSYYTLNLPEKHRVPIDKYALLPLQLLHRGVIEKEDFFEPQPVDIKYLKPAHDENYLNRALNLELTPKEAKRIGYPYDDYLVKRELCIVQGTLAGADIALDKGLALNVAGGTHHAGSNWGEGFCLFNDVAVAALYLLREKNIQQILIIDLDVHQGNGTAEILQNEPRAFTFSMHGKHNFPFEKEKSDLDVGLEDGTTGALYLKILEENLTNLFEQLQPDFVFYLAGADVLATDRLGRLNLTKNDCKYRDRMVFEFCKKGDVPVQVGTAGGYAKRVGEVVDVHCQTFEEAIQTIWF